MVVWFVGVLLMTQAAVPSADLLLEIADAHYEKRAENGNIDKAIEAYEAVLDLQLNYEAAWKLSKAHWFLGTKDYDQRKRHFENGIEAGKKAVSADPHRCEGHFWLGVNRGLLAEASGPFRALSLVDEVKDAINQAMQIDQKCECGGPDRVLGRLYSQLPWFKGGSRSKAIAHLQRSLQICPQDTQSRLFLAEIYIEQDKLELALQQLKQVLELEPDPAWIPETNANKIKAEETITRLKNK